MMKKKIPFLATKEKVMKVLEGVVEGALSNASKSTSKPRNKKPVALKIAKDVAKISPLGRLVVNTYDEIEKAKKINVAKKEINELNARAMKLYKVTQSDIEHFGQLKTDICSSFSDFCNCIEKIQQRPEFSEIKYDGVELPYLDLKDLETASIEAKKIMQEVVKKQMSWGGIALLGDLSMLSVVTFVALPCFSLSLLAPRLFGEKTSDKEIWEEIESNKAKASKIIRRLSEIDYAVVDYCDVLELVYSKYELSIKDFQAIVTKHSNAQGTVHWACLNEAEKLKIQNSILFVGLLYEMCKVQLLRVDKKNNSLKINSSSKYKMIKKAESVMSAGSNE